ncbi:MAG TPA: PEGA domain-containing protein [bacterium]|uniref:PEGA domain protein n=1 Tax=candidate division TA06 bacterium ADurb.Bin417 TaxID=1852828 RepID=A0A1V5MLA7_UNCT6|nr:MAG: PEGA domain protein [candidate division TA06 bacterium ADurb.Bin417]HNQ34997.1 PEGA domain-containing protein [bacterium]HNS49248.1 PEGA domain-containing protein [bacterium]
MIRRLGLTVLALGFFTLIFSSRPAFAADGYLHVTSTPAGATVLVDGKEAGKTPLLTTAAAGKHAVLVTLENYKNATQSVTIVAGQVARLDLTLEKETTPTTNGRRWGDIFRGGKGNLTVTSDWKNTQVYIDGQKHTQNAPFTIKDMESGFHSVILVNGDYAIHDRVLVQNGKSVTVEKSFEELKKSWTTASATASAKEALAAKYAALPARITIQLVKSTSKTSKSDQPFSFQYRKTGTEEWTVKELEWGAKETETFEVEKGTYEFQMIAYHYKDEDILGGILTQRKKVGEGRVTLTKELVRDTLYTFTLTYDGKSSLTNKLEEKAINTKLE